MMASDTQWAPLRPKRRVPASAATRGDSSHGQQRQHVVVDEVHENVNHHDCAGAQDKAQGDVAFGVLDFVGGKRAIVPAVVSPEGCDHGDSEGREKPPTGRRGQFHGAAHGPVHQREAQRHQGHHRTDLGPGQDGLEPTRLAHTAIVNGGQNHDGEASRELLLHGIDRKEVGKVLPESHGDGRYTARLHRQEKRPAAEEAHQMPVSLAKIDVLATGLRKHRGQFRER